MADCKNGAADGCETDTAVDLNNCGGCGLKCPTPANGEASCVAGVCGVSTCGARYKDCNASAVDGCEIDTFRDVNNCGTCGNVCPGAANAVGVCILGQCQLACQASYLDCKNGPADGCETNGANDINNCGNCGNACTAVGATTPACAAGSCITTMCTGTNQTCKAGPIDSCETDTATSVANCGACGKQCGAVANATPGCAASNCGIGSCKANFDDCDKLLANGCEVDLSSDPNNCSKCGSKCTFANATPLCQTSACALGTCNAGFADCDKKPANGCEINTTNDINNCGMCGNVCTAGNVCSGGICHSPYPNVCDMGTDPQFGTPWVVCKADAKTAWLSHANSGGGEFHFLEICQLLGYAKVVCWDGTANNVCGYVGDTGSSCLKPGAFTCGRDPAAPNDGSDIFGGIIHFTVQWQCSN